MIVAGMPAIRQPNRLPHPDAPRRPLRTCAGSGLKGVALGSARWLSRGKPLDLLMADRLALVHVSQSISCQGSALGCGVRLRATPKNPVVPRMPAVRIACMGELESGADGSSGQQRVCGLPPVRQTLRRVAFPVVPQSGTVGGLGRPPFAGQPDDAHWRTAAG